MSRERSVASLSNQLVLQWRFGEQPLAALTNAGSWTKASTVVAHKFRGEVPIRQSLVDDTLYHSFCFIDDDADGLHELWESSTARNVPTVVGVEGAQKRAADWTRRSDDIFAPSTSGFFEVIGRDPESVIANFAVGKGIAGADDTTVKAQSKPLASTRVIRRLELCSIHATLELKSAGCASDSAFVAIDGFRREHDGILAIQFASAPIDQGAYQLFTNIPNVPSFVEASWYLDLGIMKFQSRAGEKLEAEVWARAMSQTLYRPKGRSEERVKSFIFGVGGLPFFDNASDSSSYHFYDFVPRTSDTITFDSAVNLAQSSVGHELRCGMESYLATITSEAEQRHLGKVMATGPQAEWVNGWIGAQSPASGHYRWVTGPEAGTQFWSGDGVAGTAY